MTKPGFTLIEVLIASLIFTLVAITGTTSFLGASRIGAKTQVTRDSVAQARFAMEAMVRDVRVAKDYQIVNPSTLKITTLDPQGNDENVIYSLDSTTREILVSRDGGVSSSSLTGRDVVRVRTLTFANRFADQSGSAAKAWPYIEIDLVVEPANPVASRPETSVPYELKSAATLRNFNKY